MESRLRWFEHVEGRVRGKESAGNVTAKKGKSVRPNKRPMDNTKHDMAAAII